MYLERHHKNNIRSLQSVSETLRRLPYIQKLSLSEGPPPKTCQWIHGEATHRDFCGLPVKTNSSYCPEHHSACYRKIILTEDRQP